MEIPRKSWIRSINMKCSKQMLTTAPYFVCVYNKDYIYIYYLIYLFIFIYLLLIYLFIYYIYIYIYH